MGVLEQILSPDPLVPGEGEAGDAHSIKIRQPPAAFNFEAFFVNVGTVGKQFTETASFQRFVLGTPKPPAATVRKWKLSMYGLSREDGELQVRLGLLQTDGIWDLFGFRHHATLGYPSLNELPFGTNDATDAINAGVLLGDRFLGGGSGRVIRTDAGWLNAHTTIGEGYAGLDEILVGSTADLQTHLDSLSTMLAFTLDPFDENNVPLTSIAFASEDHPDSALRPLLFIEWSFEGIQTAGDLVAVASESEITGAISASTSPITASASAQVMTAESTETATPITAAGTAKPPSVTAAPGQSFEAESSD